MEELIRESDYQQKNYDIFRDNDCLSVTLSYPNLIDGRVRFIEIDQESVRASDGMRLFYDYERDGWVIQKPVKLVWPADATDFDPGWKEVAFIQTWALEEEQNTWKKSIGFSRGDD